jgi:hypothetical protein
MSFKFTLVLLAAAVIAVASFSLAQREVPPTTQASASASSTVQIVDLAQPSLTSVDIKSGDKETLLEKSGSGWKLSKPVDDTNVDLAKVGTLFNELAPLVSPTTIAQPGSDLTPYGLASPKVTVVLTAGNKTETLLLGDKNVNGNQTYAVRKEGSPVALVPTALATAVTDMLNNPPQATPTPVPSTPAAPASASS